MTPVAAIKSSIPARSTAPSVSATAMRDAGTAVDGRTYDGMFHGFLSMVEWIDAGKVAFDDAVAALNIAFGRA